MTYLINATAGIKQINEGFDVVPAGKIKCYITAGYRNDTPEEHVRQRMARSLVEEYGYSKANIEIEWPIIIGRSKKRADIVIFEDGAPHTTENIVLIVEAKRESINPNNKDNGISQMFSYLFATPNSKYGLWVGSEIKAYKKVIIKGKWETEDIIDIPFADGEVHVGNSFAELVPATDALKDVFKRCHNYIAANQGGSKEAAFHEFLKITFCKAYDERNSVTPMFYINIGEQHTLTGQEKVLNRINTLFSDVCKDYGYIFGEDDKVNLKPNVCSYLVSELQKYSLIETDFDYKGRAYEEIVGSNSRGERGEFFTPRNLCQLAVEIIVKLIGKDKIYDVKLLDPACGTGGFLKSYVHILYGEIYNTEMKKWKDSNKAREYSRNRLKTICDRNIFGIDFNPILVRAAQMNMVMHGDGSSNIFHENSLLNCGEWSDKTREYVCDNSFDIILTNPPFGEDLAVDDRHVLNQYALSTFESKSRRNIMAPQELFLERCYKLLKPGGLISIVTPDNILSNPSYKFIRHWLLLKYRIIASISLPLEMFQPSTGTQTSLLVMQKREIPINGFEELKLLSLHENIFISTPEKIGHDQRGSPVFRRDGAGDIILNLVKKKQFIRDSNGNWTEYIKEVQEPLLDDDLPQVYNDFLKWYDVYGGGL